MIVCVAKSGRGGPLTRELLLARIKYRAIYDRRLLAGQDLVLIFDLTDIEPVAQQIEQRATAEENTPSGGAGREPSRFGSDISRPEVSHQCIDAAEFEVASVDQADPLCLV